MTVMQGIVILAILAFTTVLPSLAVAYWMIWIEDAPDEKIDRAWKRVFWAGTVLGIFLVWLFYRMS